MIPNTFILTTESWETFTYTELLLVCFLYLRMVKRDDSKFASLCGNDRDAGTTQLIALWMPKSYNYTI